MAGMREPGRAAHSVLRRSRSPAGRVGKRRPGNAEGQRPTRPRLDVLKVRFAGLRQLLHTRGIVLHTRSLSVPEATSASRGQFKLAPVFPFITLSCKHRFPSFIQLCSR